MLLFVAFALGEIVFVDCFAVAVVFFEVVTELLLLEREVVVERFEAVAEGLAFDVVVDLLFAFVVNLLVVALLLLVTFEGVIFRPLVLLPAVAFGEFFAVVLFEGVAFLADALLVVLLDLVIFEDLVLATDNLFGELGRILEDSHRQTESVRGVQCVCRVERSSGKTGKLKHLGNLDKIDGLRKPNGDYGRNCQTGYTSDSRFPPFIYKDLSTSATTPSPAQPLNST